MTAAVLFLLAVICGTMAVGQQDTTMDQDGIDQFGYKTCSSDSDIVEEKNKQLVLDFMQTVFGDKDIEAVDKYIVENNYIQHSPFLADGRESLKTWLVGILKDRPKGKVDIPRVAADGDLVWIHLRTKKNDKVTSTVDIFRLKDYKIVEHWGVTQDVPKTSLNSHPMF